MGPWFQRGQVLTTGPCAQVPTSSRAKVPKRPGVQAPKGPNTQGSNAPRSPSAQESKLPSIQQPKFPRAEGCKVPGVQGPKGKLNGETSHGCGVDVIAAVDVQVPSPPLTRNIPRIGPYYVLPSVDPRHPLPLFLRQSSRSSVSVEFYTTME